MIEIVIRFAIVGVPLSLAIASARRALVSRSLNAGIYIIYSGYATVAGLSLLPWATYLDRPAPAAVILAASAVVFWGAINRYLRRPIIGYRPRSGLGRPPHELPVFVRSSSQTSG